VTLTSNINDAIDTVQHISSSPAGRLISLVFPQASVVLEIINRYQGTIDRAQPIIEKAIEAGEPVFEEVVKQLPKFAVVVSSVLHAAPASSGTVASQTVGHGVSAENVTRILGGFPHMTFEQEMKWMNDKTPGNDPSQENSRNAIG
jgi:hypothetical protein